ncbi:MAG: bifunctional oligoribonuclease/PAP phosphatase NrnA [Patescibacteria group bacterium]
MQSYINGQIHDILLKARKPVFISDRRIDGDSLGSALALVDYMKQHNVNIPVFVPEPVPDQYRKLPHVDNCVTDKKVFDDSNIDLVVVFDCSEEAYVHELLANCSSSPFVINIDHHVTNTRYGDMNLVVTDAPATAFLIYQFFRSNNLIPSKHAATALLTGICFDTNMFSNSATDQKSLDAASDLLMSGARAQDVIRSMYRNKSVQALRMWGMALERIIIHSKIDAASTCIKRDDLKKTGVTDEEIGGLSNFLSLVLSTKTIFVLKETMDTCVSVSMRSSVYDVGDFAKTCGGGGHCRAAGFTIPNSKITCGENGDWEVVDSNGKVVLCENSINEYEFSKLSN